ncbi:MAG: Pyruvate:Oxaloacetate transcarboxylase domain protein [Firmicutes bacterium]|nr:Pyruvate:Oxaloacetate transcarboxylase domain protein [Bacillota bacterium]MDI6706367.1 oxaloacetate decarboxylase subunit alpha [Bacillota bacterium]
MTRVKITETIFRDAHQSLIATRMTTDEMLPIAEKIDKIGYHSIEMWGGATFDASLRFLNEDPWERLRKIKNKMKNTPLQMLLRGQNILGYKHYADDVVEEFVKRAIYNGIDIVRIFDALNDVRNLQKAMEVTVKEGAHAQGAISYTISPVHTTEVYVKLAKEMVEMGAGSICIKDMSGLLTPYYAFELVKALKEAVTVPIQLHSHCTSGLAPMTYIKAIEAGVDVVDTSLSPFGSGTAQPPTEPLVAALQGTPNDTGLDMNLLNEIAEYFKPIKEKYIDNGMLNPKVLSVDINTLVYQVPGGMLSNLVSQLKMQNALDKYDEVLNEIPKVREDLGYPPLVTPTSQIVGTQAVMNVLSGERYKMIPVEVKNYVKGLYGRPTVPIAEDIKKKIIGDEEVIDHRPADDIPPQLEELRNEIKEYIEQEEDVLSYALFPQVAIKYFEYRRAQKYKIDSELVNLQDRTHPV